MIPEIPPGCYCTGRVGSVLLGKFAPGLGWEAPSLIDKRLQVRAATCTTRPPSPCSRFFLASTTHASSFP